MDRCLPRRHSDHTDGLGTAGRALYGIWLLTYRYYTICGHTAQLLCDQREHFVYLILSNVIHDAHITLTNRALIVILYTNERHQSYAARHSRFQNYTFVRKMMHGYMTGHSSHHATIVINQSLQTYSAEQVKRNAII